MNIKKNPNINPENVSEETLTRAHLRDILCRELNLTRNESAKLLDSILATWFDFIVSGPYMKIVSFGTFLLHDKKARIGRNPKTKESVRITPRQSVSFRPSAILRRQVNRP